MPRRSVVVAVAVMIGVALAVGAYGVRSWLGGTPEGEQAPVAASSLGGTPTSSGDPSQGIAESPSAASRPETGAGAEVAAATDPGAEAGRMEDPEAEGDEESARVSGLDQALALQGRLRDPALSVDAKVEAVEALVELAGEWNGVDRGEIDAIVQALGEAAVEGPPEVAEAAVEALAEVPDGERLGALSDALRSSGSEDVRLAAIDAIVELDTDGVPGAAQALLPGLNDASANVREETAWALGWIDERDPRSLQPLVTALRRETEGLAADWMVDAIELIAEDTGGTPEAILGRSE